MSAGRAPVWIAPGADGNLWFAEGGVSSGIGRITPNGQITEFSNGLNPGSIPIGTAPGADGNLWFTDFSATSKAIGRITPNGQITEFSNGLNPGSDPSAIAPGADGNLWFTDDGVTKAIGRIGTGAAMATQAAPTLAGAGRAGSAESCQAQWASWAGVSPSASLSSFDGYRWLRDGVPIAGHSRQSYTPTGGDIGHQLACEITVSYPLPLLVTPASATSAALTVQPALVDGGVGGGGVPALTALRVSPNMFTLTGRRINRHCRALTRANRRHAPCTRPITVKVSYALSRAASMTFTIERTTPGRLINGHCTATTRANHRAHACTRVLVRATLKQTGAAGANSFLLPARIGHLTLAPGSYRLLATPTAQERTGNQQRATLQIAR